MNIKSIKIFILFSFFILFLNGCSGNFTKKSGKFKHNTPLALMSPLIKGVLCLNFPDFFVKLPEEHPFKNKMKNENNINIFIDLIFIDFLYLIFKINYQI
jgi:hypothetical protein